MTYHQRSDKTARGSKPKRKRTRRVGPPQLQWLVITDPAELRDPENKRHVRSQAMVHWKYSQNPSAHVLTSATPTVHSPSVVSELQQGPFLESSTDESRERFEQTEQYLSPALSSSAYHRHVSTCQLLAVRSCDRPASIVTAYEDTEEHEGRLMNILVGQLAVYYQMEDSVNPSSMIPLFQNPEWDAEVLIRKSVRVFATDSTIAKWLPPLLSDPYLILSSTILTSSWMDMEAGCSGASRRTAEIRQETFRMLNERINSHHDDATLMVILHVLAGEMWNCDEKSVRIHETGVARFISARGGIENLENRAVAEFAAACCYHCDIFCEVDQLLEFRDWVPLDVPKNETGPLPESPLFCYNIDFETIPNNTSCSIATYQVLCDMRDLTNLFIKKTTKDIKEEDEERTSLSLQDYPKEVSAIRERLASLPSAYSPGHETSNDWVYEACRIAALIYTTAIFFEVPLSVAADPNHYRDLSGSSSTANSDVTRQLLSVLERTDVGNIWSDMAGVLYWVCAVGAAAARTPAALDESLQFLPRCASDQVWVRRCLVMHATRTMLILIFQHPTPMIMAQKKLLQVQELIGTYDAKASTT